MTNENDTSPGDADTPANAPTADEAHAAVQDAIFSDPKVAPLTTPAPRVHDDVPEPSEMARFNEQLEGIEDRMRWMQHQLNAAVSAPQPWELSHVFKGPSIFKRAGFWFAWVVFCIWTAPKRYILAKHEFARQLNYFNTFMAPDVSGDSGMFAKGSIFGPKANDPPVFSFKVFDAMLRWVDYGDYRGRSHQRSWGSIFDGTFD